MRKVSQNKLKSAVLSAKDRYVVKIVAHKSYNVNDNHLPNPTSTRSLLTPKSDFSILGRHHIFVTPRFSV